MAGQAAVVGGPWFMWALAPGRVRLPPEELAALDAYLAGRGLAALPCEGLLWHVFKFLEMRYRTTRFESACAACGIAADRLGPWQGAERSLEFARQLRSNLLPAPAPAPAASQVAEVAEQGVAGGRGLHDAALPARLAGVSV